MDVSISRIMNNNLTQVNISDLTLWFSYETVVAYREPQGERVVSENVWSVTTGRHLAEIDGGVKVNKDRLPHDEFQKRLTKVLRRYRLKVGV